LTTPSTSPAKSKTTPAKEKATPTKSKITSAKDGTTPKRKRAAPKSAKKSEAESQVEGNDVTASKSMAEIGPENQAYEGDDDEDVREAKKYKHSKSDEDGGYRV
jgi:hypothetical protein